MDANNSCTYLGSINTPNGEFNRVAIKGFPYELHSDPRREDKLCRFLYCLGMNIAIYEGEPIRITSGSSKIAEVHSINEDGIMDTSIGEVVLIVPSFRNEINLFNNFINGRVYDAATDPYLT